MSLFYSNPLGGRVGFFQFCASPLTPWLGWIVLKFRGFCRQLFAHFLQPALAHFLNVVYFFNMILIFLFHINRFNVRQECKVMSAVAALALAWKSQVKTLLSDLRLRVQLPQSPSCSTYYYYYFLGWPGEWCGCGGGGDCRPFLPKYLL